MSKKDRQTALLKVLAAAAWADGRLDPEEINRIKELMLSYGLDEAQCSDVESLLETPVSYDRCEVLTRELLTKLTTDAERREAIDEVEAIFRADGVVDESEREVLENLRGIMESLSAVDTFMTRISGTFRRVFARRSGAGSAALDAYPKNLVLRRVDDLTGGAWRGKIGAAELNRCTLFGAVLGKVADTEDGIAPAETARIRHRLGKAFSLEASLLDPVMRAVEEVSDADMDRQALLSEFNRTADMPERRELLDAAFDVAAGDGEIGPEELRELRLIANFLWIDPRDFNATRRRWKDRLAT